MFTLLLGLSMAAVCAQDDLGRQFANPPDSARPWVYWMIMDGNLTREGITADLEAMKRAGIGGAIFMETNIGIPRGPVDFMSPQWRDLLKHAVKEAERLGLEITLNAGPGWTGSGGPWVKPEQSMQHIVASEKSVTGPLRFDAVLPRPQPRSPFFGVGTLTPELAKAWREFYKDVAVLAFPTPEGSSRIADIDEKALYYRAPYSSQPGVKPFLPAPAEHPPVPVDQCIAAERIVDLTAKLAPNGRLVWEVPAGNWTVLRFGRTTTGQVTRPAPSPGLGFECDKFDKAALDAHFEAFIGSLLKTVGPRADSHAGWTMLHIDSWEMSSQNWSEKFREEFKTRRGYDLLKYLPVTTGRVVGSAEISERFLWDLRQTAQELVVENHAFHLKELGRRHGFGLSIEPYDLNPCADLALGSAADVPMCEFWSKGHGFRTEFSCFEAASIAHTLGRPIVAAEAFTATDSEAWRQHPASMKAQGDWALAAGINRFVFHRYQHQPYLDRWPGMTFGPYGVHWERTQTWWDMVPAFHTYLARCQHMLRRGLPVADILYLAPEGAPHVFRPPSSATHGDLPDRLGYNFDGCSPDTLIARAAVKDDRIVFPEGMSYQILVLPRFDTMTPRLLRKIKDLVAAGATAMGSPPRKSPSLTDYPRCDEEVKQLAAELWGKPRVLRDDSGPSSIASAVDPLRSAKWIWHREGNPAASAPVGKRYFRRTIEMDANQAIASARFTMTADNEFQLFVNGRSAGSGDNFHVAYSFDVTEWLKPGANVVTVTGENTGESPNPAGLIGALVIRFQDGTTTVLNTDAKWTSSTEPKGAWKPAMELGPMGMAPWHLGSTPQSLPDVYPNYAVTARALAEINVPPDFEADAEVRYSHRHDGDTDIYFVANCTSRPISATCRFRVTGRQPEWWDPLTGSCRDLPDYDEKDGRTTVPLHFEPCESGFVVFRKARGPTSPTRPTGPTGPTAARRNFPEPATVVALESPWQVTFDPKWGGPEKTTFAKLEDWSQRPESGIKYYSGKAVYRTTFDVPHWSDRSKNRFILSLGDVKNMASIRLNGKDLGVAWCEPWRLEVPAGAIKERGNTLEITVANLWINRLIGDSALPQARRLTWTTWNPYRPNSPLQPSGLLGPVKLLER